MQSRCSCHCSWHIWPTGDEFVLKGEYTILILTCLWIAEQLPSVLKSEDHLGEVMLEAQEMCKLSKASSKASLICLIDKSPSG
eukprot:6184937-Pleurochrysis_carterae.AAC.2